MFPTRKVTTKLPEGLFASFQEFRLQNLSASCSPHIPPCHHIPFRNPSPNLPYRTPNPSQGTYTLATPRSKPQPLSQLSQQIQPRIPFLPLTASHHRPTNITIYVQKVMVEPRTEPNQTEIFGSDMATYLKHTGRFWFRKVKTEHIWVGSWFWVERSELRPYLVL